MAITFLGVPLDLRVPGVYTEVDPSRARATGLAVQAQKIIYMAPALATGTGTQDTPTLVASGAKADLIGGVGSVFAEMGRAIKDANRFTEVWGIPLADGTTAATGSIVVAVSSPKAGTLFLLIGGRPVRVAVETTDTATTLGDKIEAAITADKRLLVSGANVTGTVTLTAKNKGTLGNDIPVLINYYTGEETPDGVTVTITGMSGGATDPSITTAVDNMGDVWYQYGICPYFDATSLDTLRDDAAIRFSPTKQIDIMWFVSSTDIHGNLTTLGNSRNDPHLTILGRPTNPTPAYLTAASYGATVAWYGGQDAARPFQTLHLPGVLPELPENEFTFEENDNLLHDGISTSVPAAGGIQRIQRAITTYQFDDVDQPDDTFLNVNTLLQLTEYRFQVRTRLLARFPRHKLADDTFKPQPGQPVARSIDIKRELVALFSELVEIGLVENKEQYIEDLVVERSGTDPDLVNAQDAPDLVNQLRGLAIQHQFLLLQPEA